MSRRLRTLLGWLLVAAGVACGAGALWKLDRPAPPADRTAMPVMPAASIVVPGGVEGAFRAPTAAEMASLRASIAAELEALLPAGGERLPSTSGVAYTLGARGASVALLWPTGEGPAVACADVPELAP